MGITAITLLVSSAVCAYSTPRADVVLRLPIENVGGMAFSPDESMLAVVVRQSGDKNNQVWIYDVNRGTHVEWEAPNQYLTGLLVFGPGGDMLAVGDSFGAVYLFRCAGDAVSHDRSQGWTLVRTLETPESVAIINVKFLQTLHRLIVISTSIGGTVGSVIDYQNGKVRGGWGFDFLALGATVSPDGSTVWLSTVFDSEGRTRMVARAYRASDWKLMHEVEAPGSLTISANGKWIANLNFEGLVIGPPPNLYHLQVWDARTGGGVRNVERLGEFVAPTPRVVPTFSGDSKYLAYVSLEGGHRVDYDENSPAEPGKAAENSFDYPTVKGGHRVIKIWNPETQRSIVVPDVAANVNSVQFMPRSLRLAVIDADGLLQIRDVSALLDQPSEPHAFSYQPKFRGHGFHRWRSRKRYR